MHLANAGSRTFIIIIKPQKQRQAAYQRRTITIGTVLRRFWMCSVQLLFPYQDVATKRYTAYNAEDAGVSRQQPPACEGGPNMVFIQLGLSMVPSVDVCWGVAFLQVLPIPGNCV